MAAVVLPPCPIAPVAEVTTGEQWRQQHPTWLLESLRAGTITDRTDDGDTTHPVEVHGLGVLPLPDGRIVGCDPYLVHDDQVPFDLTVPAGDHPTAVGLVRLAEDHVRPTALLVVTGTAPVVRWTMTHTDEPGAEDALGPGAIIGYGVDAGTGALFSRAALPALVAVRDEDEGMLEDPLSEALEASPLDAVLLPPRDGALAVAQCTSGWGDGVYATWVGWDQAGAVSLVMTDFRVTDDPWTPDRAATPPAPPAADTTAPLPTSPAPAEAPPDGRRGGLFRRRGR